MPRILILALKGHKRSAQGIALGTRRLPVLSRLISRREIQLPPQIMAPDHDRIRSNLVPQRVRSKSLFTIPLGHGKLVCTLSTAPR